MWDYAHEVPPVSYSTIPNTFLNLIPGPTSYRLLAIQMLMVRDEGARAAETEGGKYSNDAYERNGLRDDCCHFFVSMTLQCAIRICVHVVTSVFVCVNVYVCVSVW